MNLNTRMQLKKLTHQTKGPAPSAILASLAMFLLVCGSACQMTPPSDGNPPPDTGPVSFADDIQPVLSTACTGCHSPGGSAMLAGIPQDLTAGNAYEAIVGRLSVQDPTWTLVVPGDAENSLLYQKVSSNTPPVGVRMPRFAPRLSQSAISLIERWINEGALDN